MTDPNPDWLISETTVREHPRFRHVTIYEKELVSSRELSDAELWDHIKPHTPMVQVTRHGKPQLRKLGDVTVYVYRYDRQYDSGD